MKRSKQASWTSCEGTIVTGENDMRSIKQIWLTGCVCALSLHVCATQAAQLRAAVVDEAGAPVPDAVVYAVPVGAQASAAKHAKAIIDQIKRRFVPLVSVVQTGTAVSFPNRDNIEHDVYSFSPAKRFELHLYHGIPAKPVVFDKPGLVVMGCNIHDQMIAYLLVVDTPWFAKTDARGQAAIDGLPAGAYRMTVWHYRMTEPARLPSRDIAADAAEPAAFKLRLKSE
ncbi:MAG TPA: methylamine utilization protein [Trinickia sp.]|nr:methylamine utilization protein [Trinickia sp.]